MSEWKQKRFWTDVTVEEEGDGFAVALDGRRVKTPVKAPLLVPTRALAEAIAREWEAQEGVIDPLSMPHTRTANAALDKVTHQFAEVADMLAGYGDSDLLCYRAESPEELAARQAARWDEALDWAAEALDARLTPRIGVMHQPQPAEALQLLRAKVHEQSAFQLAAFHDLVGLTGSLILGFAATRNWRPLDDIWELAHLDERWQEELWGPDDEAQAMEATKKKAFEHAAGFYALV
ncbi:ATP12 family chaperone protein [Phaeobacter sp. HF9A]|uniref:ATP12 family chaperone protein n=1 Tax=Phaeobacter sp. HF9A TaxID=2721561 RepID=UPI0014315DA0|nr:ATP12 family protein [Phaeobacter sp. HF9A]NIZ14811.1 ATPase [Phaeobacter sp. HF9A]